MRKKFTQSILVGPIRFLSPAPKEAPTIGSDKRLGSRPSEATSKEFSYF